MKKNIVKLTESQLKKVIAESVKKVLYESFNDPGDIIDMSSEEDEFKTEIYNTIVQFAVPLFGQGYTVKDLKSFVCEIFDEAMKDSDILKSIEWAERSKDYDRLEAPQDRRLDY